MKRPLPWTISAPLLLALGWSAGHLTHSRLPQRQMPDQAPPLAVPAFSDPTPSPTSPEKLEAGLPKAPVLPEAAPGTKPALPAGQSLQAILRQTDTASRQNELFKRVNAMSAAELSAAVAMARRLSSTERDALIPVLTGKWARSDPKAALRFALEMDAKSSRFGGTSATRAALSTWVANNLEEARAWVVSFPPTEEQKSVLAGFVDILARTDPEEALRVIAKCPKGKSPEYPYATLFRTWAARDPAAAGAHILALPESLRNRAMGATVSEWAKSDPIACLAWTASLPDAESRQLQTGAALRTWVVDDLPGATAYLEAMPEGETRNRAWASAAETLKYTNAPLAMEWAGKIPEGPERLKTIQSALTEWAKNDPNAAGEYALTLPPSESRTTTIGRIARNWASNEEDIPGALAWVQQIPDDTARKEAARNVALQWVESNPRQAAEYWKNTTPHGSDDTETQAEIVGRWAAKDLAAAVRWGTQLAESDTREGVLACLAYTWADQDVPKTVDWLKTLPAGASREMAVSALSVKIAETDPEKAIGWMNTLGNATTRQEGIEELAQDWLESDAAAAKKWISSSKLLSKATRTRLLEKSQSHAETQRRRD